MATNNIIKCPDDRTRSLDVGASKKPGDVAHAGGYYGVSLNGTGDYTQDPFVVGGDNGFTVSGIKPNANIEPNAHMTTLALGGVWLLPVEGVVPETTVGTPVYAKPDDTLTLTADGATAFGYIYNNGEGNTATASAVDIKGAI